MKKKKISISVSDSIGSVSGELMIADDMEAMYVFAHGAGAGMDHAFMVNLSTALAAAKISTLRYNFPFIEKGSKRPDVPAVAEKCVIRAIRTAGELFPGITLVAGGKSFGGRMTSQAMSKSPDPAVKGIVFAGFPLHAPGKPGTERAAHLKSVAVPMLFLQGTRDALAEITLIEEVCSGLTDATLVKFVGADHSFRAGKKDLTGPLIEAIRDWLAKLPAAGKHSRRSGQ